MKRFLLFALILGLAAGARAENITRWMVIGQSNAVGSGTLTTPKRSRDTANALCIQDYYGDGRRLVDPTSQQGGAGASFLPSFGSYLAIKYGVQEHFLNFSVSNTHLIGTDGTVWGYRNPANHADVTTLYGLTLAQINAYYGANHCGIVFLQGESDADAAVSDSAYDTTLTHFIGWFRQDLGYTVPFFIIQIGRRPSGSDAGTATIQTVQEKICNNTDIVFGACTYDLNMQSDSSHFDYDGQDTIGKRLGITVSRWIDGTLGNGYRYRATAIANSVRKKIVLTTETQTATANKSNFDFLTGTYAPPVMLNASGNMNINLNTDLSQTATLRFAYGKHPSITNLPRSVDGFPLEPIHNYQTITPYSGTITSSLGFNDKDLDFALFFNRVRNMTENKYSGNYPIYPSDVYTATMNGMAAGEGYIYKQDTSYLLVTGANRSMTLNRNLTVTADSKFTFAFKLYYGISTDDYVTLFQFGTGGNVCQAYLRSITGGRAMDFSTFISAADVGYAQPMAATLPTPAQDVFLCFVKDGATLKTYVNGVESTYGFHVAYSGGTYTFTNLTMFNYSAVKCYWAMFFNDALSQARIDSLNALPNNLGLYGYASGDTMALQTTASTGGNGGLAGGLAGAFVGAAFAAWAFRKKIFRGGAFR
jgi:hypothetical protein